jgi:hypothetical protein
MQIPGKRGDDLDRVTSGGKSFDDPGDNETCGGDIWLEVRREDDELQRAVSKAWR